jgi:hypothetical protein
LESVNKIQAKVVFLELAAEFYLDAINILSNIYFVEKYWHTKFVEMKQQTLCIVFLVCDVLRKFRFL